MAILILGIIIGSALAALILLEAYVLLRQTTTAPPSRTPIPPGTPALHRRSAVQARAAFCATFQARFPGTPCP